MREKISSAGEDVEKRNPPSLLVVMENAVAAAGDSVVVLPNQQSPHDSLRLCVCGHISKIPERGTKDICTHIFIAFFSPE